MALHGARGAVHHPARGRDRRADAHRTQPRQRRGARADALVPERDRGHGAVRVRGRARAVGGLCQPPGVRAAGLSERAAARRAAAAPPRPRREAGGVAVRRVRPAGHVAGRRAGAGVAARGARGADGAGARSAGHAVARALCARRGRARGRCVHGGAARARAAACNGGGAAGGARGAVRHDGRGTRRRDGGGLSPCCSRLWRRTPYRSSWRAPRSGAQGISGDLPVWCAEAERGVLRQWALLRALGVACDLALRSGDGGDYQQPTAGKVRGWLAALDLAHTLDAPGGVHLVPEGPSRCGGGCGHPPRHGAHALHAAVAARGDRRYLHGGRCALGR